MAGLPETISVLAELERCGVAFEWAGANELKLLCPFHDEKTPSCALNIDKQQFVCFSPACKAHGDFITLLAGILKTARHVVISDLSRRYNLDEEKTIEMAVVERYHQKIWEAERLLLELRKRGVTDALIRKYRLGEHEGRITIPIKNDSGAVVNIRRYLPGAPKGQKVKNTRGHSKMRLFPIDQLRYDKIMLCGGEIKAIVAADQLNSHGIGAITATGGEGNWDPALTPKLAGKTIVYCGDIDGPGKTAAQTICAILHKHVGWMGIAELPLDPEKYRKGDINDFVASERGDLFQVFESAKEYEPPIFAQERPDEEPEPVGLTRAIHADMAGKRVRFNAVVSTMDTAPYSVPKTLQIACDRSQKVCGLCRVYQDDQGLDYTVHPESIALLEMVRSPLESQRKAIMRALGIPSQCDSAEAVVGSYYNVEDVRISPQLEITDTLAERPLQAAICVGSPVEPNETYEMTGRMHPHPRTQQSTLVLSHAKMTQDALSAYERDVSIDLSIFRPDAWTVESLSDKIDTIYEDLETNVTRIYKRRRMHLLVDLAFHSPLLMTYDGEIAKAWCDVLIIGDSAQGKSETTMRLKSHYGVGERVECKNASAAGLLGGLQQLNGRFWVAWGVIPTYDRRLVILEEVKGMSVDIISRLTDMRSSGVAEIDKIEKRRTHARTRLIWLSNARFDRPMLAYNFGIEAIRELIGNLEDVRRFDAACVVAAGDVDADELTRLRDEKPVVEHRLDSKTCRTLVLWAWTRRGDQVTFEPDAERAVSEEAKKLNDAFTDEIPLVDRGSMRLKLARLSAALAARTFSTGGDEEQLVVRECHVRYVARLLHEEYSSRSFGYADLTAALKLTSQMTDKDAVKARIQTVSFPREFCQSLLHTPRVESQDVQDWLGWERVEANDLVSFLVRKRALVRDQKHYRKTPQFIEFLKALLENGALTERPDHVKEEY